LDQLDEEALWELMTLIQAQTVMLWELFAVNPFNQPWVEKGKIITKEMLWEHKDVFLTFFEKQSWQEKEQKEKKHETIFISP
jgi:glucose-6-phosphate isomerase